MQFLPHQFCECLEDIGFNPVSLPNFGVTPLQVRSKNGDHLTYWGRLGRVFPTTLPLPEVNPAVPAANISAQLKSDWELSVGVSILSSFVQLVGGAIGVSSAFKNTKGLSIILNGCAITSIDGSDLAEYMQSVKLPLPIVTNEKLAEERSLFVVKSILTATTLAIKASSTGGASASINVPILQQIAGGSASFSQESGADSVVVSLGGPIVVGATVSRIEMLKQADSIGTPTGSILIIGEVDSDDYDLQ